jgi:hypothetical protein
MAEWKTPETAPKDRVFLANTGWPWPVAAVWNDYMECFVTAQQEGNVCDGKSDPSWITEHERDLIGWLDMPEVPRRG